MTETQAEKESNLLKATFKDNEYLLKLLRKLFFGFDITEQEKLLIKNTFTPELREAFRKKIYSKRGDDANLGNIADFWVQLSEEKLLSAVPEQAYQMIESRIRLYKMFEQAMALLENPDGEKLNLDFIPSEFVVSNTINLSIDLMTRNKFLNAIEAGLNFINLIANTKDKTPEELKAEMKKNSSK